MRYCTGSTSLFPNSDFWKSKLTCIQKLCFFSGILYYSTFALSIISVLSQRFFFSFFFFLRSIYLDMAGRKRGLGGTAFLFPFHLGGPQATQQDFRADIVVCYPIARLRPWTWNPARRFLCCASNQTISYTSFCAEKHPPWVPPGSSIRQVVRFHSNTISSWLFNSAFLQKHTSVLQL
jgi:hypothetical protein